MGSTARFGLRYPDLSDAPNGPEQIRAVAEDADGWTSRVFRCTSSTRPAGVPNDFLIRESDTGNVMIWTGSAWAQVSGAVSSGGGGGGTTAAIGTVSATYAATAAQPITSSTDVAVAFPVAQVTDSSVVVSTQGAGHKFTLQQTRLWTVTATVRFADANGGGRTFEIRTGSGAVLAKDGDPVINGPYTRTLSACRKLAAGTAVYVVARHNAASSLALEPNAGNFVHIDLVGV